MLGYYPNPSPMSRSSRDYYHSSSDRSQQENLPPIRDVVGDVLEQPVRPRPGSRDEHRPMYRTSTPRPQANYGEPPAVRLQLPPMQSSGSADPAHARHPAHSSSSTRGHQTYSSSSPRPADPGPSQYSSSNARSHHAYSSSPRPPPQTPERQEYAPHPSAHSYDVFVSTSEQGLIHKRSSRKDDFHQVTKEDTIANSTGRHVCPECSRRFEKLSTLKNHLTTHSGDRPYECPDCGKTFSVSSNMRRHQLTHRGGESSSDRTRY